MYSMYREDLPFFSTGESLSDLFDDQVPFFSSVRSKSPDQPDVPGPDIPPVTPDVPPDSSDMITVEFSDNTSVEVPGSYDENVITFLSATIDSLGVVTI